MNDTDIMVLELGGMGYSCAQMVLAGGLRLMGRDNPDLVRAMACLAQSGELCGALSDGLCLVALHTGKGLDAEQALPESVPLMDTLVDWFRVELCSGGGITCNAILGGDGTGSVCRSIDASRCGTLVARTWEKAVGILAEAGIDPALGRETE